MSEEQQDLSGATYEQASLRNSRFHRVDLSGSQFRFVDLKQLAGRELLTLLDRLGLRARGAARAGGVEGVRGAALEGRGWLVFGGGAGCEVIAGSGACGGGGGALGPVFRIRSLSPSRSSSNSANSCCLTSSRIRSMSSNSNPPPS